MTIYDNLCIQARRLAKSVISIELNRIPNELPVSPDLVRGTAKQSDTVDSLPPLGVSIT